jgi:hypothetical protein
MVIFIANLEHFMVRTYHNLETIQAKLDCVAGPRLAVNCLTDHRTWYNLQVFIFCLSG